jgi:hypothetical protein
MRLDRITPGNDGKSRRAAETANNGLRLGDWLAGAGGFEPPHGGIKIHCLTTWLRPKSRPGTAGPGRASRTIMKRPAGSNPQTGQAPAYAHQSEADVPPPLGAPEQSRSLPEIQGLRVAWRAAGPACMAGSNRRRLAFRSGLIRRVQNGLRAGRGAAIRTPRLCRAALSRRRRRHYSMDTWSMVQAAVAFGRQPSLADQTGMSPMSRATKRSGGA